MFKQHGTKMGTRVARPSRISDSRLKPHPQSAHRLPRSLSPASFGARVQTRSIVQSGLLALCLGLTSCHPGSRTAPVSGTIETDEVRVASRYGGRVQEIFAREGAALRTGQTLVQLEAPELRARHDQMAALLAEQEAGPRLEEIAAAKADWQAQGADLDFARADAKRANELFAQNTISVTERDRADTRANLLEKNVAAARSRYELLLAGTRPEQIARTRAQLAEIDAQLGEMKVFAPSDSVLEVLSVKVGDVLAANQQVATLLLPQHIWVRVFVPQTWLGGIKLGGPARVRVDAFPGKDFNGTVEQVAREAEFTPRNVQTAEERIKQVFGIKVRLDNASGNLRAGMTGEVTFPDAGK
jgi:HlyD family secretion protein